MQDIKNFQIRNFLEVNIDNSWKVNIDNSPYQIFLSLIFKIVFNGSSMRF